MIMNSCKYKREEFNSASGSIENQFFCNFSFLTIFTEVEIPRKLKFQKKFLYTFANQFRKIKSCPLNNLTAKNVNFDSKMAIFMIQDNIKDYL